MDDCQGYITLGVLLTGSMQNHLTFGCYHLKTRSGTKYGIIIKSKINVISLSQSRLRVIVCKVEMFHCLYRQIWLLICRDMAVICPQRNAFDSTSSKKFRLPCWQYFVRVNSR